MSLELRCHFSDSSWAWHLRAWDRVEVYSRNGSSPVAVLTGAQLAQLVAHYLAQAGLVAGLLPQLGSERSLPDRKPLGRTLQGVGQRRLRGYGAS